MLAKSYVNQYGQTKCAGTGNLKGSQAYPRGFGEALACLIDERRNDMKLNASVAEDLTKKWMALAEPSDMFSGPEFTDPWVDANLAEVQAYAYGVNHAPYISM